MHKAIYYSLDAEGESSPFYADGIVYFRSMTNNGYSGDVNAIRHVLYNCSASRPSIESETKEDTIEPGTETLSITADPHSDGLVKARTGNTTNKAAYADWYKSVYLPTEKESGQEGA